MNNDEYVQSILEKYKPEPSLVLYVQSMIVDPLSRMLISAFRGSLSSVKLSGSFAKGTSVKGGVDVDLFLSFYPDRGYTLRDIYQDTYEFANSSGLSPKKQNVSVAITYSKTAVDLVPGRQQPGSTTDHWLFRRRAGKWTQTNVDKHITLVKMSGQASDIRLLKIWRNLHGLDFPSFYLELTTLEALRSVSDPSLSSRFVKLLTYLSQEFSSARVVDPANTANIVSEDLSVLEKSKVVVAATRALSSNWSEVLW